MTQADTAQRWAKLAQKPCPTEGGYTQGGKHDGACICKGTGLAAPELTRVCPDSQGRFGSPPLPECKWCHGTGRVPLQGDLLLAAGERVLDRLLPEGWLYRILPYPHRRHTYERQDKEGSLIIGQDGDCLTALLEALEAVLEAES